MPCPQAAAFSCLPSGNCILLPLPLTCSLSSQRPSTIKVVVNGACSPIGRAAILAIAKTRGMELGGAVDSISVGKDAGEVAGLEGPLELPISRDLVLVLSSLSQGSAPGVMVDFTHASKVVENVRQATAFGLRSVVAVQGVESDKVATLSTFCEKANMGCVIAPTLSVAAVLLQQASSAAAFYYKQVEIVESRQDTSEFPSPEATQLAESISGIGQQYNKCDSPTDVLARGVVVGDGVRIHSLALSGFISSTAIHFSAPGEVLSFRHDVTDVEALMPGLLIAIRRVIRLKSLVYGLEKVL